MEESKIDDGGPAFPHDAVHGNPGGFAEPHDGMTLRDYFAAKALLIAGVIEQENASLERKPRASSSDIVRTAYKLADAMLKERAPSE